MYIDALVTGEGRISTASLESEPRLVLKADLLKILSLLDCHFMESEEKKRYENSVFICIKGEYAGQRVWI